MDGCEWMATGTLSETKSSFASFPPASTCPFAGGLVVGGFGLPDLLSGPSNVLLSLFEVGQFLGGSVLSRIEVSISDGF